MHGARGGEAAHAVAKGRRCREPAGMQLRIAAGEPGDVAVVRRRLVGERRERHQLRTGGAPMGGDMRVEEGEGGIGRQRDALAGRRQRGHVVGARRRQRRGERGDAVEVERALRHVGEPVEMPGEVRVLAGLHQAEMALRQGQRRVPQDGADHRHADRLDGVGGQAPVTLAAQPVEDDAGDPHVAVVGGEALGDGGGGLRLTGGVEHQDDRQAIEARQVGRRAGAAGHPRNAVEKAHGALDDQQVHRLAPPARPARRAGPAPSPSCRG